MSVARHYSSYHWTGVRNSKPLEGTAYLGKIHKHLKLVLRLIWYSKIRPYKSWEKMCYVGSEDSMWGETCLAIPKGAGYMCQFDRLDLTLKGENVAHNWHYFPASELRISVYEGQ